MQKQGPPPEFPMAVVAIAAVIGLVLVMIGLAIAIFYCLSMSKALSRVSARNRLMEPGMVWLLLIPLFGVIWNFFVVIRVPGSLQNEFEDRGEDDRSDYGKGMGMTAAVLYAVTLTMSCIPFVNYCAGFVWLIWLVFGIIFWVKIASYSGRLAALGEGRAAVDDDDDEDDKRPSKSRRRRDDED